MSRMVADVTPMPIGVDDTFETVQVGELALHMRRDPTDGHSVYGTRLRGLYTDQAGKSPRVVRVVEGELWKRALTNVGRWSGPHEMQDGDAFLEAESDLTARLELAQRIIEGMKPISIGSVELVDPVTGEKTGVVEPYL